MKTTHIIISAVSVSLLSACAPQKPAPAPYAGRAGDSGYAQASQSSNTAKRKSTGAGAASGVQDQNASAPSANRRNQVGAGASSSGAQASVRSSSQNNGPSESGATSSQAAQSNAGAQPKQTGAASAKSAVIGTWSGTSEGERIVVKMGQNGSVSLTNSGGANSGEWAPGAGQGRYSVRFDGRMGEFVLVNAKTATLKVLGSTIELHR